MYGVFLGETRGKDDQLYTVGYEILYVIQTALELCARNRLGMERARRKHHHSRVGQCSSEDIHKAQKRSLGVPPYYLALAEATCVLALSTKISESSKLPKSSESLARQCPHWARACPMRGALKTYTSAPSGSRACWCALNGSGRRSVKSGSVRDYP